MSKLEQHTLYKDLPSAKDEQFLMRRLSVFNWGTFSKIHTLRFADDGSLLLGPSGAGKSTLLDAVSAMIVPPKKVRFNAAAEEGDRRGHDRTIGSYVRGAWADKGDAESRDAVKQYLRPNGAVSAIALEYGNRLGRTLTLVRLFWITGASTSANVNMHYVVTDGSFDLRSLASFDGDGRKLKKLLSNMDGVRQHETFAAYQEHWCRIMGIEEESALELLHKTQSTKSLGDLNTFLRQFMLDEPETFAKADALVAEFGELDEAHRAVVDARQQIEVLGPARDHYAEHGRLMKDQVDKELLHKATEAFTQNMRVSLIEAELVRLKAEVEIAQAESDSNAPRISALFDELQELGRRHHDAGGADITSTEARLADYKQKRETRSANKAKAELQCRDLGWMLADTPQEFAEQIAQARAIDEDSQKRDTSLQQEGVDLSVEIRDLLAEQKLLKDEIDVLEGSSTNIPPNLQRIRDRMCSELRIPPAKVVFVGELLQVRREDAREWEGAVERLIGGFGRDLIVDENLHKSVAQWVDRTHLGLKLVYHPVKAGVSPPLRQTRTANSIINKLERKPHAFSDWVHGELLTRFDYECVPNAIDLTRGDNRITAAGQIRHSRGRTEKDDRGQLNDRRNFVLGFDSREKLELLRSDLKTVGDKLLIATTKAKAIEADRQKDLLRGKAASKLCDWTWTDIDVATMADLIAELEEKLQKLKSGNAELIDIEGQMAKARLAYQGLNTRQAELGGILRNSNDHLQSYGKMLQTARVEAGALEGKHRDALRARFPQDWKPTLASLVTDIQRVKDKIRDEMMENVTQMARVETKINTAFAKFLSNWTVEAGSLQANMECAPDFFAKLERLESDGLPKHEDRFRNLLSQQSTQRLAELSKHVLGGRREIDLRLSDVNEALNAVSYNPDSFIRINSVDLYLPEVIDFRERLRQIFEGQRQMGDDPEKDEQQFVKLRQLVMDLKAEEPEQKRWRDRVLDIRQHVEFNAEELDRKTEHQIEFYSGSSGKSGGQRQKLTATCLASALRYKLGGTDGGPPTYATVVLDEAFTKTDDSFTRTCMQVFKELGFQMIVATPIKSVMTLEEFVGGANYVMIENRNKSAVKAIEYLEDERKLNLSDEDRARAQDDADR